MSVAFCIGLNKQDILIIRRKKVAGHLKTYHSNVVVGIIEGNHAANGLCYQGYLA